MQGDDIAALGRKLRQDRIDDFLWPKVAPVGRHDVAANRQIAAHVQRKEWLRLGRRQRPLAPAIGGAEQHGSMAGDAAQQPLQGIQLQPQPQARDGLDLGVKEGMRADLMAFGNHAAHKAGRFQQAAADDEKRRRNGFFPQNIKYFQGVARIWAVIEGQDDHIVLARTEPPHRIGLRHRAIALPHNQPAGRIQRQPALSNAVGLGHLHERALPVMADVIAQRHALKGLRRIKRHGGPASGVFQTQRPDRHARQRIARQNAALVAQRDGIEQPDEVAVSLIVGPVDPCVQGVGGKVDLPLMPGGAAHRLAIADDLWQGMASLPVKAKAAERDDQPPGPQRGDGIGDVLLEPRLRGQGGLGRVGRHLGEGAQHHQVRGVLHRSLAPDRALDRGDKAGLALHQGQPMPDVGEKRGKGRVADVDAKTGIAVVGDQPRHPFRQPRAGRGGKGRGRSGGRNGQNRQHPRPAAIRPQPRQHAARIAGIRPRRPDLGRRRVQRVPVGQHHINRAAAGPLGRRAPVGLVGQKGIGQGAGGSLGCDRRCAAPGGGRGGRISLFGLWHMPGRGAGHPCHGTYAQGKRAQPAQQQGKPDQHRRARPSRPPLRHIQKDRALRATPFRQGGSRFRCQLRSRRRRFCLLEAAG